MKNNILITIVFSNIFKIFNVLHFKYYSTTSHPLLKQSYVHDLGRLESSLRFQTLHDT